LLTRNIPKEYNAEVIDQVLSLCSKIWNLVSVILTNDSPEGNLFNLLTEQRPLQSDSELEGQANPETSLLRDGAMQDLLSSSWRSLKEASALLGTALASGAAIFRHYQSAGTLFMDWLSNIRHRGAFSAVMPSFENLSSQCFKSNSAEIRNLPAQWLDVF
jgi:hypothetical protein